MPSPDFFIMDDIVKPNSKVICRIDINSPINKDGEILGKWRFYAHKETLKWLIDNNIAVILLAHQGRPNSHDFTDLSKHAEVLEDVLETDVKFVPDIIGKKAIEEVRNANPGDIILLDNVRKLPDEMEKRSIEEHAKSSIVRALSPYADYFILDGFSVAHRQHASVVGFASVLPSAAGFLFAKEIENLSKYLNLEHYNFIFGGAKVSDVVKSIKMLKEKNKSIRIFLTGLTALVFHYAKGIRLPKDTEALILKKAGSLIEDIRQLLVSTEIYLPLDYAIEQNGNRVEVSLDELSQINLPPKDIGTETIKFFISKLKDEKIVFLKGPAGVIEEPLFRVGTIKLLEDLAKANIFLVFFGGHLASIIENSKFIRPDQYYISTGGGSAIQYLSNGTLPGIEALKLSRKLFYG